MQADASEADDILARIGGEAKAAFEAEVDFYRWRVKNMSAPIKEFMNRCEDYSVRAGPLLTSYRKLESEHPQLMAKADAIIRPIQQEMFGADF
jgi:hypothetical protein